MNLVGPYAQFLVICLLDFVFQSADEVDLTPENGDDSAGYLLFFSGATALEVSMDVIASTTSGDSYEYYYDRYTLILNLPTTPPTPPQVAPPTPGPVDPPTPPPVDLPTPPPVDPPTPPPVDPPTPPPVDPPTPPPVEPPTPPPVKQDPPTPPPVDPPTPPPVEPPTPPPVKQDPGTPAPETPQPSLRPSAQPSQAPPRSPTPSTNPTDSPIAAEPTDEPAERGDNSTPSPSQAPSSMPTAPPTPVPMVTRTIQQLQLLLEGVNILDSSASDQFVATTEKWYEDFYATSDDTRRRRLQVQVSDLTTTLVVQEQSERISNDGETVTNAILYSQTLSYREPPGNEPVDPIDLVTAPFDSQTHRADYYERLRVADPAFADVVDNQAPLDNTLAETKSGGDDGDSGFDNIFFIAGLAALAGVLVIGLAVLLLFRRTKNRSDESLPIEEKEQKQQQKQQQKQESLANSDTVENPGTELIIDGDEISALYTPSVSNFSYDAEQSLSTSKSLGGEQSGQICV